MLSVQSLADPGPGPSTLRSRQRLMAFRSIAQRGNNINRDHDEDHQATTTPYLQVRQETWTSEAISTGPTEGMSSVQSSNLPEPTSLATQSNTADDTSTASQASLSSTPLFYGSSTDIQASASTSTWTSQGYDSFTTRATSTGTTSLPRPSSDAGLEVYVPLSGQPLRQGGNGLLVNMTLGGQVIGQSYVLVTFIS